ncbi:hypothetical protein IQ07DRAFT_496059 [Pyrenochaeta sp. DS3sAY3a]|nr:hypothetical protein IQ07DRAFT_496059 [Pyrenochaeta sp. DS3sAY3a]
MNNSLSTYTHLESLLLFQCLHAYGVGPAVFGTISDVLKRDPDVTAHPFFHEPRLSPDALRAFYLDRLRREIENEQGAEAEGHSPNGALSRKRKLPPASLPTVQESLQHQHLIPKLITKLYASYRNEIAEHIRAEEDRYERLQREIQSIQRGEWDDQLRERANQRSSASRSPTLPKKSPRLVQKPLQPSPAPQAFQNGTLGGPVNPSVPDAPQQPQPPPQAPVQGYNGGPYPNLSPYPPGPQSQPSPQQNVARLQHSQSPVMGSPGPQFPPPHMHAYGSPGVPHYAPPPGTPQHYSPTHQRFPHQQAPGPQSPSMQSLQQQPRPPHPQGGQQGYPPHQPQSGQPPPQAGFMLPPFQVSPQDPSRVHQTPTPSPYPQVSTPSSNRQQARAHVQTPVTARSGIPPVHPLVTQARQTFSTPVSNRSPLSTVGTPVSAKSVWKRQSFGGSPASPATPRPDVEPIDDFEALDRSKTSAPKGKAQRPSRAKGKGKAKDTTKESEPEPAPDSDPIQDSKSVETQEEDTNEVEMRSGRSRRKAPAKRARPGSIASSRAGGSVRERSRSQSILSHTETVAADNESQAGHRIKSERGTSVDAIEEESVGTPTQMSTRRRGVTSHAASSFRRKRNARDASLEEADDQFSTPGPPKSIIAQRHFSRMCDPIMNDIKSHKHASTFTSAVRAKDAEGYYDIIKRPTDLKTIQKAIAVGAKQVAAAASSDTPVGSPGGAGGVVELPMTLDNTPPKAIVNASQLEKELMRMFVNAVMFNPGEDGVVEDARQMFETVQRSVSSWRNVERGNGGGSGARTEVEDTPTAEEEEVTQVPKRRKL